MVKLWIQVGFDTTLILIHFESLVSWTISRLLQPGPAIFFARSEYINLDLQRSVYSGYFRVHGYKAQIVWLPIGLIGCVFVCEVHQNDNGVQNISGLNNYLVKLFRTCLLATGFYPCVFCGEIYAVLATIVLRFVNPTPAERLLNMMLNGLRI